MNSCPVADCTQCRTEAEDAYTDFDWQTIVPPPTQQNDTPPG